MNDRNKYDPIDDDLSRFMPSADELEKFMETGEFIIRWEELFPSARLSDHETATI